MANLLRHCPASAYYSCEDINVYLYLLFLNNCYKDAFWLSHYIFKIFQRGPKFVPTPPETDLIEFQKGYTHWKIKLKWVCHNEFEELEKVPVPPPLDSLISTPETEINPHTQSQMLAEKALCKEMKSEYSAHQNQNYALELFLHRVDLGIKIHKEKVSLGDNLTKGER